MFIRWFIIVLWAWLMLDMSSKKGASLLIKPAINDMSRADLASVCDTKYIVYRSKTGTQFTWTTKKARFDYCGRAATLRPNKM